MSAVSDMSARLGLTNISDSSKIGARSKGQINISNALKYFHRSPPAQGIFGFGTPRNCHPTFIIRRTGVVLVPSILLEPCEAYLQHAAWSHLHPTRFIELHLLKPAPILVQYRNLLNVSLHKCLLISLGENYFAKRCCLLYN